MLGVKNITYTRNNSSFCIDIGEENTIFYENIKREIKEDEIFNYLNNLFRIIDTWQEEYINTSLIDGDNWELLINYTDGRIKKYSGHAAFPSNFEAFERLNQDIRG